MKKRLSDEVFRYLIEKQIKYLEDSDDKDWQMFVLSVGDIVYFGDLADYRQNDIVSSLPSHLTKRALDGLTPTQEDEVRKIIQSALDTGSA